MEKIVVTLEQEKAAKEFINGLFKKTRNEIFKIFIITKEHGPFMTDVFKPLNEISDQDFFFMLHGWYEVEQAKFKVGDWVFDTVLKEYRKVIEDNCLENPGMYIKTVNKLGCFEKVTEEWKIVLLELGREKPELKKGDKIINIRDVNIEISEERDRYDFRQIKYFYPVESRIEIKQ